MLIDINISNLMSIQWSKARISTTKRLNRQYTSPPPPDDPSRQQNRNFFLQLAKEMSIPGSNPSQSELLSLLYKTTFHQVTSKGARKIILPYGDSVVEALKHLFPEHDWKEWLFDKAPQKFWQSAQNQKRFLEWLGEDLGISSFEEWYNVGLNAVKKKGAARLLSTTEKSLPELLMALYPEHNWKIWKFKQVPQGYWSVAQNRRSTMEKFGAELGIRKLEDWYSVTSEQLASIGALKLVRNVYGGSLCVALQNAYPDHEWLEWRFEKSPKGFWDSVENQIKYVDWLGKQLGISAPEQWYNVPTQHVLERHGSTLLNMHSNQLGKLLNFVYPGEKWELWKFSRSPAGEWSPRKRVKREQSSNDLSDSNSGES
jgi:hypothetical protein